MAKIQIKRGLQANVSNLVLSEGELAVALDTGNVYIGTTAGTTHINPKGGTADTAVKLSTGRPISITGDATAPAVTFDGTAAVQLLLSLAASGVAAGTYTKVTVDSKGRVTSGNSLAISDLPELKMANISDFPKNVSAFTNDAEYQTAEDVRASIAALTGSAPELLDTLSEIAQALGNDPNFATTMMGELGNKENLIKNAGAKTSIVDADTIPLSDSANDSVTKKITFSNLKKALKTYFDGYYNKFTYTLPTASATTLGGVKIGNGLNINSGVLTVGDIDGGSF